jgi:type I restriction enzyme S subunit
VQRAIEQQEHLMALALELKKALLHQLFSLGLCNEPQRQTGLGTIPQSWDMVPLGSLMSEYPKNGLYKHSSHYGTGTLILRINDFSNDGDIVVSATDRTQITEQEQQAYSLSKDDIVVNRVNSLSHLGKTAIVGELSDAMVFESNMMRFRANASKVLPHFLFHWMNSPSCKAQIVGSAKRAVAQSSINQGDLKAIVLPLPSLEEQAEIVFYFEQIESRVSLHHRKLGSLRALFSTLLHELMTAKLLVNDLDLNSL